MNSKTLDGYKYILFVYDTFENIKNSKTDIAEGIVNKESIYAQWSCSHIQW